MTLEFDLNAIATTEFGVGRDLDSTEAYTAIPVDEEVQYALQDMAVNTKDAMDEFGEGMRYEPADKYASLDYVVLPNDDDSASSVRLLHEADNLPMDVRALSDPSQVSSYFGRFTDEQGRRLTAIRRATQFKGVLKSRLIRLTTDTLRLIPDEVFKLDLDFDVLVDSEGVHILRPAGFEYLAKLKKAILAAVPQNVAALQAAVPFLDIESIAEYAKSHPRAARALASLRVQGELANVDRALLKKRCKEGGITVTQTQGRLSMPTESVLPFLEMLDRRRYSVELIRNTPERFRAGSRQRLK